MSPLPSLQDEITALRRSLARADRIIDDYREQLAIAEERMAIQSSWIEYLQEKQRRAAQEEDHSRRQVIKGEDQQEQRTAEPLNHSPRSSPLPDCRFDNTTEPIICSSSKHPNSFGSYYFCSSPHQLKCDRTAETPVSDAFCAPSAGKRCFQSFQAASLSRNHSGRGYTVCEQDSSSSADQEAYDRQELLPRGVTLSTTEHPRRMDRRELRSLLCIVPTV